MTRVGGMVITGLGTVTPLGHDAAASWQRLIEGRSAAGPIVAFDAGGFPVRDACEVKEFDPSGGLNRDRRGR
jgi:3-oxoacyl-[acyl-carrier-protein] synthase II